MKRLLGILTVVAVCVVGGTASAADMRRPFVKAPPPVVAPFSWTGFYIGAFAGGLWGDKDWLEIVGPVPGGVINPSYDGFIGGGTLGFNYQIGSFVFGIEGDAGGSTASGYTRCISSPLIQCGVEVEAVAMLTGRIGFAWDRALVYAKGGGVWVWEDYPVGIGGAAPFTLSHDRSGWTIGGGFEYAFWNTWSAKIEYNYLDLGTDRLNFQGAIEDISQEAHIVKVGVNYRFNWR